MKVVPRFEFFHTLSVPGSPGWHYALWADRMVRKRPSARTDVRPVFLKEVGRTISRKNGVSHSLCAASMPLQNRSKLAGDVGRTGDSLLVRIRHGSERACPSIQTHDQPISSQPLKFGSSSDTGAIPPGNRPLSTAWRFFPLRMSARSCNSRSTPRGSGDCESRPATSRKFAG